MNGSRFLVSHPSFPMGLQLAHLWRGITLNTARNFLIARNPPPLLNKTAVFRASSSGPGSR